MYGHKFFLNFVMASLEEYRLINSRNSMVFDLETSVNFLTRTSTNQAIP
jgi:hypothetical protein